MHRYAHVMHRYASKYAIKKPASREIYMYIPTATVKNIHVYFNGWITMKRYLIDKLKD